MMNTPSLNGARLGGLAFTTLFLTHATAGEALGKAPSAKQPVLPPVPVVTSRSHFSINAGAAYRSIGDVRFLTGSQSGSVDLPFLASALGHTPASVGNANTYADRVYRDGNVHQDGGTPADGLTGYWGYQNASQLSANTLTFHGENPSAINGGGSRSNRSAGSWDTDGDGVAPVIQLDYSYDLRPNLSAGFSLQYSFLSFDGRQSGSNFSATQTESTTEANVTDTYETTGLVIPLSPYQGTLAGPGVLISNKPSSRSLGNGRLLDSSRVSFFNQIEESLDVRLHTLTLGPTLGTKVGRVGCSFGSGLALNIVDWTATHQETLYIQRDHGPAKIYQRWNDRASKTNVLPGIYVQGAASISLTDHFTFTVFGNYDWSRSLTGHVGPSHFTIDPSGWMLGGMFGYAF